MLEREPAHSLARMHLRHSLESVGQELHGMTTELAQNACQLEKSHDHADALAAPPWPACSQHRAHEGGTGNVIGYHVPMLVPRLLDCFEGRARLAVQ